MWLVLNYNQVKYRLLNLHLKVDNDWKFKKLIAFYPTPGVSTEYMHVFLATDLKPERGTPDEDEVIEVQEFTSKQVLYMVKAGKIQDAKTLVAFLYLRELS